MPDIKISLDQPSGENLSIVRVDGVVDTLTAAELEKVMNSLLSQKRYRIVVDLAGVDYVSSAGWGIFVSNIREVRVNQGDIKLARMAPGVYEVFELLEFDSILRAFDSLEQARQDFGPGASIPTSGRPAPAPTVSASENRSKSPVPTPSFRAGGAEELLLSLIAEDPFYSFGELKAELARRGFVLGSWELFRLLWRKNLFSAKSRFRYARSASRRALRLS
jgi:anti-sigma B factor antagonist